MDPRTAKMLAERQAQAPPSVPIRRGSVMSPRVAAWLSVNWFRAAIATAVLALALSVAYYTLITLPTLRRDEIAAQQQAEKQRALRFLANDQGAEACLSDADADYTANWTKACESVGLGTDCSLLPTRANRIDQIRRESRNECFKRYPPR
jgi:hypothetical protein